MPLQLTRPLVALDIETHAKDNPRIVEIGFHIRYPDGRKPKRWVSLVNPEAHIEFTDVHGITDEDVANAPKFSQLAANLAKGFVDCDFCGYHVKFDLQILASEMQRAGVQWTYEGANILDGLRLWQVAKPRTLGDAVREHLKREQTKAHRALEDAEDALEVAEAMLNQYSGLPQTMPEIHKLCFPKNPDWVDDDGKILWLPSGMACLSFGKHQKRALQDVPRDYLAWMLSNNFPSTTRRIIEDALSGKFPVKEST